MRAPALVLTLSVTLALLPAAPAAAECTTGENLVPTEDCRQHLWAIAHDGEAASHEGAGQIVTSPDGLTAYVTGSTSAGGGDGLLLAIDVATGERRWAVSFDVGREVAAVRGPAVSEDGATVLVALTIRGDGEPWARDDLLTIAFDAEGTERWRATYDGPEGMNEDARAVAIHGDTAYALAQSDGTETRTDAQVLAYDLATGEERWRHRFDLGLADEERPRAIAADEEGVYLFIEAIGRERQTDAPFDFVTVALDPEDGAHRWTATWNGPADEWDTVTTGALSEDGSTVYIAGSARWTWNHNYTVVAYDAATGEERWVGEYDGPPGDTADWLRDLAVSPDGATVAVTGQSWDDPTTWDLVTVGFDGETGERRWVHRYHGPGDRGDAGNGVGFSPDGETVYATGGSAGIFQCGLDCAGYLADVATLAYDARSGVVAWEARYVGRGITYLTFPYPEPVGQHRGGSNDVGVDLAVATDGTVLSLAQLTTEDPERDDLGVIAYAP